MPLLAVHMSIAQEAAERLDLRPLTGRLGALLLGCTAPDRRVLTRQPREETHFFDLSRDGVGDGLRGLRRAHPDLLRLDGDDWGLLAFLIGYVSHLAADETWIVHVYRPFFTGGAYLGEDPARNILDRALQYDLERGELANQDNVDFWRRHLRVGPPGVPPGFIPQETLTQWHDFVLNVVTLRDGGWHEFPRFVARFRDDPGLDQSQVEEFLANPDLMFQRVFSVVPRDILAHHREQAVEATIAMAREILP